MPTLLRTFDIVRLYNFCIGLWPFAYIALPLLNFIARSGLNETTGQTDVPTKSILWIGIAIVLAGSRIGCLAYSYVFPCISLNRTNACRNVAVSA
jgi:hypothetical protein